MSRPGRKRFWTPPNRQCGFTLVEVIITAVIAVLLLGSATRLIASAERSARTARETQALQRAGEFAMNRIERAVRGARICFVPLNENPATAWSESVRNVLAVSLDPGIDRDMDGWADANNDRDWMDYDNDNVRDPGEPERVDEDPGHDWTMDAAPGIVGVDDDGDGLVDELMVFEDPDKSNQDDDEDGWKNEDNFNGYDDDGDGAVDEDIKNEENDDEAPGLVNVDDDFDGAIDEGLPGMKKDDDEDGVENEDWPEVVVFFPGAGEVYADSANGAPIGAPAGEAGQLYERLPNFDPADGRDFTDRPLATGVTGFTVTRLPRVLTAPFTVVEVTLALSDQRGNEVSIVRRMRLGEAL